MRTIIVTSSADPTLVGKTLGTGGIVDITDYADLMRRALAADKSSSWQRLPYPETD